MAKEVFYGINENMVRMRRDLRLDSIFVDFNSAGLPQDSQIVEYIFEKSGKNYVFLKTIDGATGFINEDVIFEIQDDTDYHSIATKIAFNIAFAMQFGETNLKFIDQNNSLSVEHEIYYEEEDQLKIVDKNIPVVTLDNIKILVGNTYFSLFDIEYIKSELTNKNIDYSKLPVEVISYMFEFINGTINVEEEARKMAGDYISTSCVFINSIMNGNFDSEEFDSSHFWYEREYIIDRNYIERFYKFINSFQKTNSDMVVYRATNGYSLNSNSFISTSLSKYFSSEWAREDLPHELHKIFVPKDSLFFTPIFYDKQLGGNEAEVILLPGTFEFLEQNDVNIYSGKSIEEVMSSFLFQLEQQKKEILLANKQEEQSFDDAILYGKQLLAINQKIGMKK